MNFKIRLSVSMRLRLMETCEMRKGSDGRMEFLAWTSSRIINFQDVVMRMSSYQKIMNDGKRGVGDICCFAQHSYSLRNNPSK